MRITDFAPRFTDRGRTFRPVLLVRRITPVHGRPTIRMRLQPAFEYGARRPDITRGSHHIRYFHAGQALRLTTDMPIAYAIDETWHLLDRPVNLLFGVDETVDRNVGDVAREFEERTDDYWRRWVRALALPPEWQDAVIRAAITLKLCTYEETGAIMAAVTTSIPEAPDTRAHVGLPLLLAARRVLRRPRAERLVRGRDDGELLRYLVNVVAPGRARAICSRCTASASRSRIPSA